MPISPHLRKLLIQLNDHPVVWKAKYSLSGISVKYINGIEEKWLKEPPNKRYYWIYDLPEDPGDVVDIKIGHEFPLNPLDDDYERLESYFIVRASDYKNSGFASCRVMTHVLTERLCQEGWIHTKRPHQDLIDDFMEFRSDDTLRYDLGRSSRLYGAHGINHSPGLKILEHFVPFGEYGDEKSIKECWSRPANVYCAIAYLVEMGRDITRLSIARTLNGHREGPGGALLRSPVLYRAIFKMFDIQDLVVADPNPGIGAKALASAAHGCQYFYGDGTFSAAAGPLSKFLGVDFEPINMDRQYDLVLLDGCFDLHYDPISAIRKWKDIADMALVFVPHEYMPKLSDILQKREIVSTPAYDDRKNDFLVLV